MDVSSNITSARSRTPIRRLSSPIIRRHSDHLSLLHVCRVSVRHLAIQAEDDYLISREDELVSTDIIQDPRASIIDLSMPQVSNQTLLDIGTGAYSTFPYLVAALFEVQVTAVDIAPPFARQVRNYP